MFSKIIQRKLLFISSIILDKIDKKRDYYINDLHDFIFSNEGKLLNLSACKKRISVSYPITNNGTLNLDKGKYLSQIQVDIFNISDKFFYDCCLLSWSCCFDYDENFEYGLYTLCSRL